MKVISNIDNNSVYQESVNQRIRQGFTLVETMMTLAILVILTGVVAMGIPVAIRTYTQATNYSNAQLIASTVLTELRNGMGLAQEVYPVSDDDTEVECYLSGDGYWEQIKADSTGAVVKKACTASNGKEAEEKLNSDSGYQKTYIVSTDARDALKVDYKVTYKNDIFTVKDMKIIDSSGEIILSLDESYEIQAFSLDNNDLTTA